MFSDGFLPVSVLYGDYATCPLVHRWYIDDVALTSRHQPIPAQLAHLHWSSGHDFRLSGVKSRQARETGVRFPDGELILLLFRWLPENNLQQGWQLFGDLGLRLEVAPKLPI